MITNLQEARRLYFHLERKGKKEKADKLIEFLLLAAKKNDPCGKETVASDPMETIFNTPEPELQLELLTKLEWLLQGKEFDLLRNMEDLQFDEAFASSENDEEDFLVFAREKGRFDFWHLNKHVKKSDYVQDYRRHITMKLYDDDMKRKRTVDDFEAKMAKIDTSKKSNRAKIRKLEEEYLKSI